MGFLTPILFRNDSIHVLKNKKMQGQICEKIFSACCNREKRDIAFHHPEGGIEVNPVISLGCKHADEQRTIVVFGNTWIDLSEQAWGKLDSNHLDYLKDCIKIAKQDLAKLTKKIKALENGNT